MIRRAVARILLLTFICQHPAAMAAPVPVSGAADVAREPASRATRSEPSEHTERAAPPPKAAVTGGGDAPTGLLPLSLDLGAARRFNGFFFEGFTAPSSDIQGRLAAGSFVSLNHYSIASELRPTAAGPSLVVGGELTFPEGRVYVGDIVVGGSALGLGQPVREGLGPNQHVYEFAPLPFDLDRERERITQTSQALAALSPNGTFEWKWGGLYLHGDCKSPSQVFALSGEQVLAAHTFQVDCLPVGATVIFNVDGTKAGLTNVSLESLAAHQSTTLFNFHEAQTLTLSGVGIRASVPAPLAHVDKPRGVTYGTIVARSWDGPMELHNVPFRGVGTGDFCPLLPIALPHSLLASAEPGQQFVRCPVAPAPGSSPG